MFTSLYGFMRLHPEHLANLSLLCSFSVAASSIEVKIVHLLGLETSVVSRCSFNCSECSAIYISSLEGRLIIVVKGVVSENNMFRYLT